MREELSNLSSAMACDKIGERREENFSAPALEKAFLLRNFLFIYFRRTANNFCARQKVSLVFFMLQMPIENMIYDFTRGLLEIVFPKTGTTRQHKKLLLTHRQKIKQKSSV